MAESDQWYAQQQQQQQHAGFEAPQQKSSKLPWVLLVILLLLFGALAFWGYRRIKTLQGERAGAGAAVEQQLEGLRAQLAAVVAERDRLASQLAEAEGRLRSEAAEADQLASQLRGQVTTGEGEVSSQRGRISVNLLDKILFPSGSAALSPGGKQVLNRVGKVLKEIRNKQIIVGGHTDDVATRPEMFPTNWELSALRAVNVVRYLQEGVRVDARRLTAAGYSQFHPISKNRARNRRIEILLLPGEIVVDR